MRRAHGWLLVALAVAAPAAIACDTRERSAGGPSLQVDLDGDGSVDTLTVERLGKDIIVSLERPGNEPQRLHFAAVDLGCTPVTHVPECGMPVPALSKFVLDAGVIEGFVLMFDLDSADRFVANGRAHAVTMPVGETDPMHFYWDAKTRQLSWLRL